MAHHNFNPGSANTEKRTETWLTPRAVLDSLGGSDAFVFDPCAAPRPRPWPTAREMSSLPIDGLAIDWPTEGVVWCNPPYDGLRQWSERCVEHKEAGGSVILLIFNRTDTRAFQDHILPNADLLHFIRGRLKFARADGTEASTAGAASVLVAMGDEATERLLRCTYPGRAFVSAPYLEDLI